VLIVSFALVALTLAPLARRPDDDGFPLSTYPMFATRRSTTVTLTYAFATTRTGERRAIPPSLVGSREVLQARAILASSDPTALCATIAARAARDDDFDDAATISIVTGRHDAVAYLVDQAPGHERVRATCAVPR